MARTRAHSCRGKANSHLTTGVIPGREAKRREPGIHPTAILAAQWIPGSRSRAPRNDEGEPKRRIPE